MFIHLFYLFINLKLFFGLLFNFFNLNDKNLKNLFCSVSNFDKFNENIQIFLISNLYSYFTEIYQIISNDTQTKFYQFYILIKLTSTFFIIFISKDIPFIWYFKIFYKLLGYLF